MRPVSLFALALALAGCVNVFPCRPDTVLLSFRLGGASLRADTLAVAVSVDGGAPHSSSVKLQGSVSGSAEIQFPHGFPAGHTITIVVRALLGDQVLAAQSGTVAMADHCGTLSIILDGGDDMAAADLAPAPDQVSCLASCPATAVCGQLSDGCGGWLSCGACQVTALTPSIANAGATLTLEGTFADQTTVSFPGVAQPQPATRLGPHRATVVVPPAPPPAISASSAAACRSRRCRSVAPPSRCGSVPSTTSTSRPTWGGRCRRRTSAARWWSRTAASTRSAAMS
jgi:hypothetical protein